MNYLNSSNGISFCVLKNNDLNVINMKIDKWLGIIIGFMLVVGVFRSLFDFNLCIFYDKSIKAFEIKNKSWKIFLLETECLNSE